MRITVLVPATALALAIAVDRGYSEPITLEQAVARASRRPSVAMADAEVDAAQGAAAGARRAIYNPELSVAAGPRFAGETRGVEVDVSLAQTIELGGKRSARASAAESRARAASAHLSAETRDAELETRRTFSLALVAQARVEAARRAEEFARQMETATRDRQGLGAGTQLQMNLAVAEVGRARHDRTDSENQYERELAALATAVGAGPNERLEPSGTLAAPSEPTWTEEDLVQRALVARPELVEARSEREAAGAEVRLADALARPDLTMGVSYGFEQDIEVDAHTVLVTAAINLPVRNRNQGERSATRARLRHAEIDERRQRDELVRDARLAHRNYVRAREAVLGFDQQVNERLQENLVLARESFESGKIDYFEFNVVRHELLASQSAYLDAVAESIDAWHALASVVGKELVQ